MEEILHQLRDRLFFPLFKPGFLHPGGVGVLPSSLFSLKGSKRPSCCFQNPKSLKKCHTNQPTDSPAFWLERCASSQQHLHDGLRIFWVNFMEFPSHKNEDPKKHHRFLGKVSLACGSTCHHPVYIKKRCKKLHLLMLWGENYSLASFYNNHLDNLFGAIWIPIFPKICNRGFSETKTSHLSSNFRFRKVQITTQKNPWSADPGPGPKKNKICTQVITTGNESGWNVFFGEKNIYILL